MVRSTTAATATARPVLTTSPPDPDAPSFAGVEHPFLSLRGRTAFSVIARPRSGRSNLLAWGSPRPFGARDDRRAVIARPAAFLSLRGRAAFLSLRGRAAYLSLRGRAAAEAISS